MLLCYSTLLLPLILVISYATQHQCWPLFFIAQAETSSSSLCRQAPKLHYCTITRFASLFQVVLSRLRAQFIVAPSRLHALFQVVTSICTLSLSLRRRGCALKFIVVPSRRLGESWNCFCYWLQCSFPPWSFHRLNYCHCLESTKVVFHFRTLSLILLAGLEKNKEIAPTLISGSCYDRNP